MKTKYDPRHQQRIRAIKELFAHSFTPQKTHVPLAQSVIDSVEEIDKKIAKSAPQWPLESISKIDLAILRVAAFELIIEPKEPPKVVIDEAVEIAKEFAGDASPKFINGVLGTLLSEIKE